MQYKTVINTYLYFLFLICTIYGNSQEVNSLFDFKSNDQGVELFENGKPVFFYQGKPKSSDGKYIANNYLHPLYSLDGVVLTEEFPSDHPYHRGIFWAWHQLYINNEDVGNSWIMENLKQEVVSIKTQEKDSLAELKLQVLWKSLKFEDGLPFVAESTKIIIHPVQNSIRKIDFVIALEALVPNVKIGGSKDEKGYGGFCARLKLFDDLTFTSEEGLVTPKSTQIKAGPWMDFSSNFGSKGKRRGVVILCHPETPNYPASWILRANLSMQNIVFPGKELVALSMEGPLVLYYRLIIHEDEMTNTKIRNLQDEYEQTNLK